MNNDFSESVSDCNNYSEDDNCFLYPQSIPFLITERLSKPVPDARTATIRTIRYNSKNVVSASQLPVIVNLNPRSIYKKRNEFKIMMEQLDVDCCAISESWDKGDNSLEKMIKMDGYQVIKNVVQRSGKGGKPVLVIKKDKYFIKERCPTVITVPPTVEATWALLK